MITIVSGLPRSGTSMMMQLLDAGGIPLLVDGQRGADDDNPKGYCEFERVKQLKSDASWMGEAEGKAVKVIAQLLTSLPSKYTYKIIFMRRDLDEVLQSQATMLQRNGKAGANIPQEQLKRVFENQVTQVTAFLQGQDNMETLYVDYAAILQDPPSYLRQLSDFLGQPLDQEKMSTVIDPALYRNRS